MESASCVEVELPAELGIPEADALKNCLLEALERRQDIALAGAGVRRAGTAALQVLVAASIALAREHKSLVWRGASPALVEAATSLGLEKILRLAQA